MITDYNSLCATIADYLNRTDLTDQIKTFVQLAEARISRDVRIRQMLATATIPIQSTNLVTQPTGCLDVVNVTHKGYKLFFVPADLIARIEQKGPSSGTPWVYTLVGNAIRVAPAESASASLVVTYFAKPTELTGAIPGQPPPGGSPAESNWFVSNAPDLLLYAALLEAEPFILNDERIKTWQEMYVMAVGRLNQQYAVIDTHARSNQKSAGAATVAPPKEI